MGPLGALTTTRIRAILRDVQDVRLVQPRLWRGRLNRVVAADDEILAKVNVDVIAADIITDDAKAVVHGGDTVRTFGGKVPNIKHGRMFSQNMLRVIANIEDGLRLSPGDSEYFTNYIVESRQVVEQGIEDREELIINQMLEDTGVYDRLGVKFTGMTWGMASAVKITVANYWTDAANATPIADILAAKKAARDYDGTVYDRITMPEAQFNNMVATTEFQNRVKFGLVTAQASLLNLSYLSIEQKRALAQEMLGMEIEFNDDQTLVESATGAKTKTRFQSVNKVILSAKQNDNRNSVWDFAVGEVIEARLARLGGIQANGITSLSDRTYGIYSYSTLANTNLNPPGIVQWSVDRGFPRKSEEVANAVLTVAAP